MRILRNEELNRKEVELGLEVFKIIANIKRVATKPTYRKLVAQIKKLQLKRNAMRKRLGKCESIVTIPPFNIPERTEQEIIGARISEFRLSLKLCKSEEKRKELIDKINTLIKNRNIIRKSMGMKSIEVDISLAPLYNTETNPKGEQS